MRNHLYPEKALLKFNRYYIHGVRNKQEFEKAADEAFWKAREEILADLSSDSTFPSNADRESAWSDCLEVMLVFRMALKNAPPDEAKLEQIRNKRQRQVKDIEKTVDGGTSTSGVVSNAVVTGLEELTGEAGIDGPKT